MHVNGTACPPALKSPPDTFAYVSREKGSAAHGRRLQNIHRQQGQNHPGEEEAPHKGVGQPLPWPAAYHGCPRRRGDLTLFYSACLDVSAPPLYHATRRTPSVGRPLLCGRRSLNQFPSPCPPPRPAAAICQAMCCDYGFRSGTSRMYEEHDGEVPTNVFNIVSPRSKRQGLRSPASCPPPLPPPPNRPVQVHARRTYLAAPLAPYLLTNVSR